MEWLFHSSGQSAVGIKPHEEYIEFLYHALPRKFSKGEKRRELNLKKKNARKVESPLPTMKLEPTITESKNQ